MATLYIIDFVLTGMLFKFVIFVSFLFSFRYPGPNESFSPDSDAAMVMNVYRSKTADPRQSSRRSLPGINRTQPRVFRRIPPATPFTKYYTGYGKLHA